MSAALSSQNGIWFFPASKENFFMFHSLIFLSIFQFCLTKKHPPPQPSAWPTEIRPMMQMVHLDCLVQRLPSYHLDNRQESQFVLTGLNRSLSFVRALLALSVLLARRNETLFLSLPPLLKARILMPAIEMEHVLAGNAVQESQNISHPRNPSFLCRIQKRFDSRF